VTRNRLTALAVAAAALAAALSGCTAMPALAPTAPAASRPPTALPTPPMGFNDWNAFGCDVDEADIRAAADLLVSTGLRDAGYTYVGIDDCWMAGRDADRGDRARATAGRDPSTHRLVADPQRFPSGIPALVAYIHARGLKAGIYESAGTTTCEGLAGSLGYEDIDARTFAAWGIDYLKYDNCGRKTVTVDGRRLHFAADEAGYRARYQRMADALAGVDRPIVLSLCEWGVHDPWTWAPAMAGLWRTTHDIKDHYASMLAIFEQNVRLAAYAGPGRWNDPDMLEVGNGGMTDAEYRTHFALWAMMAAPLLIGTDLSTATPETLAILGNRDLIAVDQDARGAQARPVAHRGETWVLAKPLANGDVAVALFNAGESPTRIDTSARAIGAATGGLRLRDLWSGDVTKTGSSFGAVVAPHSTVVYRVTPEAPGSSSPSPSASAGSG
jgi:alpha-galactosidase